MGLGDISLNASLLILSVISIPLSIYSHISEDMGGIH